MKCVKCGTENSNLDKYCSNCGAKLEEEIELLDVEYTDDDIVVAEPPIEDFSFKTEGEEQTNIQEQEKVEEPQIVESTLVEEPQIINSIPVEEPQIVESTPIEEPQIMESAPVEEPQIVESTPVEEPQIVESTPVEEPQIIESTPVEEPQIVESTPVEEPQIINSIPVEEPQIMESAPVEEPQVIDNKLDVNNNFSNNSNLENETINNLEKEDKKLDGGKIKDFVKKYKKIILIVLVVIISIFVILKIVSLFGTSKESDKIIDLEETNAFFIKDGEGSLLFDKSGKQLSKEKYKLYYDDFINKSILVENSKKQAGVITDQGKMVVKYGDCDYLKNLGAVYECRKDEDNYLINAQGQKRKVAELSSFLDNKIDVLNDNLGIILEEDKYIYILDYNLEELLKMPLNEDKDIEKIINYNEGNYLTIYYNDITYLINLKTKKVITKIQDKQAFCVSGINSKNGDKIILTSCEKYTTPQKKIYKYIEKGEVKLTKEFIDYYSALKFDDSGNLILEDDDDREYVIDNNGSKKLKLDHVQYIDAYNYVQLNEEERQAKFYVNGEIVKTIKCNGLETHNVGDNYILECSNYKNSVYDKNGEQLTKEYDEISYFDDNKRAIVKDNKQYYLINEMGKRINNNNYEKIERILETEYYLASKNKKKIILDKDQNELINVDDVDFGKAVLGYFYTINNKKYEVYSLDQMKKIAVLEKTPVLEDKYFTVKIKNKKQYYSYENGKMFYEVEEKEK